MSRSWLFIAAVFFPTIGLGQQLVVENHSFEEPISSFTPGPPAGWDTFKPNDPGMWTEGTAGIGMSGGEGFQHAGMNSFEAYLYQDLGVVFEPHSIYSVEIATAHRSNHPNGLIEFGIWSSLEIGKDLSVAGYADLHGIWVGSGNPDADNLLDVFRDSIELNAIGNGSLAKPYSLLTGDNPPKGNVVVFLRMADVVDQNRRVQFDNVRVILNRLGDANCDGNVDLLDIAPFVESVINGRYAIKSDVNQDGVVDLLDVAPFVQLLSSS